MSELPELYVLFSWSTLTIAMESEGRKMFKYMEHPSHPILAENIV